MLCPYLVSLTIFSTVLVHCQEWQYHDNTQLEMFLRNFTKHTKGDIRTTLYSIGTSRKNNSLLVMELTASKRDKIGVPNIKLIGTVHGNEPVGRELLLFFMEYLRDNYKTDSTITWLLENTKIHFLPNLNPDGFALSNENMCTGEHVRNNGFTGEDLNRNFPDFYHENKIPEQPETRAVKKWMSDVKFILSAALHGGALVVNYPFDTVKESTSHSRNPPSLTPDNDVFVHLAEVYSQNHLKMHNGDSCHDSKFEGGITNGAAWYSIIGGMQDYNYAFHGCMELTLEISCCKYPIARELPKLWEENKKALLKYSLEALKGVTGLIIDGTTLKPISHASLRITNRNMTFFSSKRGEFWRLLLPGSYKLEVAAEGYYNQVVPFLVKNYTHSFPQLTILKIAMLNSSISTTTVEQKTTETTVKLAENTSDGASAINLSINTEMVESQDKPTAIRLFTRFGGDESSSANNQIHILLLCLLLFFLLL